jgi:hypothetical protein
MDAGVCRHRVVLELGAAGEARGETDEQGEDSPHFAHTKSQASPEGKLKGTTCKLGVSSNPVQVSLAPHRHELIEEQWQRIKDLLPAEHGRAGRPPRPNWEKWRSLARSAGLLLHTALIYAGMSRQSEPAPAAKLRLSAESRKILWRTLHCLRSTVSRAVF